MTHRQGQPKRPAGVADVPFSGSLAPSLAEYRRKCLVGCKRPSSSAYAAIFAVCSLTGSALQTAP